MDKKPRPESHGRLPGIKFIYLVIILAIICEVVLSVEVNFVWMRNFAGVLRNQAIEYELVQARRAAETMSKAADKEMDNIKELAFNLALVGTGTESEMLANRFLKINNNTREISIINLKGQEEKKYSRSQAFSQSDMEDYYLIDFFENAIQGRTSISNVNFSNYFEPYVVITTPIMDEITDTPKAVLKANYFLRGMWEIPLETKIGETGRMSVVDNKGMLVADPKPSRVLKKTNLLDFPPAKSIISGQEFKGISYRNENGIEVFGVGAPIKIGDMNWGVIIEQNTAEVESLAKEISNWLLIYLFGAAIIAIILIWLIIIIRSADSELVKRYNIGESEKRNANREKNKTAMVIHSLQDPVIVVDSEYRILLFNPQAEKVFRLHDGVIGIKLQVKDRRFLIDDLKQVSKVNFDSEVIEYDENKKPKVEEVIIKPKNGKVDRLSAFNVGKEQYAQGNQIYKVITLEVCDENECLGFMKVFYDLTREKNVERLKSEFISIAAHQLRTPLSAIKWAIKIVLDGDAGQPTKEMEETLLKGYECNERVIRLVNDMLNVSRIEEGRFGIDLKLEDPVAVLDTVIDTLAEQSKERKIKISFIKPENMPPILMDKEKMMLALSNLLENAVKYSPEDGTVQISLERNKKEVIIIIKDNGVGIPENEQANLFNKFFRGENVVRMQTEGSGLGLFITNNVIKGHKGRIVVKSREGIGTEVRVILPAEGENNTGITKV